MLGHVGGSLGDVFKLQLTAQTATALSFEYQLAFFFNGIVKAILS